MGMTFPNHSSSNWPSVRRLVVKCLQREPEIGASRRKELAGSENVGSRRNSGMLEPLKTASHPTAKDGGSQRNVFLFERRSWPIRGKAGQEPKSLEP